ncbi:MAG: cupin domain-containing protein [Bdellovibrionales bacterium]
MVVLRWQAPIVPDKKQIRSLFEAEGLTPYEEVFPPETQINWHRHPFDEVRTVVQGEVLFDIAGNQLLLRSGDRIVIPSNTKHSFKIQGTSECVCLVANKTS